MAKGRRNIDKSVKDKYLDWLMSPPSERDPATKLEVAVVLGVVPSTLYLWEATTEFQDELRQLKIKWGVKFHGEILGRLMWIVTNGTDTASIAAAKVLLPHIDTGPREVKEDDLTEEHLIAIREALKNEGYEVTG
jgi:hypothetical protein